MLRTANGYALLLVACLLAACAGLEPAASFDQKLAYAYGSHTSVLVAATNAVNGGTLSSADAEQVLELADNAKLILDGAKLAAGVGDLATAEGQLAMATTILQEVLKYLNAKRGPL